MTPALFDLVTPTTRPDLRLELRNDRRASEDADLPAFVVEDPAPRDELRPTRQADVRDRDQERRPSGEPDAARRAKTPASDAAQETGREPRSRTDYGSESPPESASVAAADTASAPSEGATKIAAQPTDTSDTTTVAAPASVASTTLVPASTAPVGVAFGGAGTGPSVAGQSTGQSTGQAASEQAAAGVASDGDVTTPPLPTAALNTIGQTNASAAHAPRAAALDQPQTQGQIQAAQAPAQINPGLAGHTQAGPAQVAQAQAGAVPAAQVQAVQAQAGLGEAGPVKSEPDATGPGKKSVAASGQVGVVSAGPAAASQNATGQVSAQTPAAGAMNAAAKPSEAVAAMSSDAGAADVAPSRTGLDGVPLDAQRADRAEAARLAQTSGAPAGPRVDAAAVASLAAKLAQRASDGATRFAIRLDPAELGRIDVRLDIERDGVARAHLTVERPETFADLSRQQRAIERALAEAGVSVARDGVEISLAEPGKQWAGDRNPSREGGAQDGGAGNAERAPERDRPDTAEVETAHGYALVRAGRLNLIV